MTNLCSQPFLLSLRQEPETTCNTESYKTLLQKQQSAFMGYLRDCCNSEVSAIKRYEFLKTADHQLCSIRLKCAGKIRENSPDFYQFWGMLIVDTRRFISVGTTTLEFQRDCPPHMLAEPTKTFPEYKWLGSRNDLTEGLVALFLAGVIRLKDGKPVSFAAFAKYVGSFFGISYSNPHDDMKKILNRKKNQTPFLYRLIESIKGKSLGLIF